MSLLQKTMYGAALVGVVTAALAQSAAAQFAAEGDPRPAIILYGPTNDGGWSQAIDEARVAMEESLDLRIPQAAEIPESATAIRPAAERFIDRGANIVIGSAFGYSDAFKELSEQYPEVLFINPSGITNGPNLKSVYGRTYESQYLCGMVAGGLSESGKIGFVAANPFPVVNWTINAYLLGARAVNPDAELSVVFTGIWGDPVKERAATEALIEQGIEVVGQHVDTPTPQIVAEEAGIYGTGHHRDLSEFSSATQCSSVWTWQKVFEPEIKAAAAGEWESTPYGAFLGISEGGTDIACCGDAVSEELAAKVKEARDAIISGELQIFAGPMADRSGTERIADGAVMTDAELWAMDWFVPGISGGE